MVRIGRLYSQPLPLIFVLCKYILEYSSFHFSFLLNKVFVTASKPEAKGIKTGFILYASNSTPLLYTVARKKTRFLNFFSTLGLIAQLKTLTKYTTKYCTVSFTKLALKFCVYPPPLFPICRQNYNVDSV